MPEDVRSQGLDQMNVRGERLSAHKIPSYLFMDPVRNLISQISAQTQTNKSSCLMRRQQEKRDDEELSIKFT